MNEERWRPVQDFVGLYEVSNLGRVRSVARYVPCHGGQRLAEGIILAQKIANERYLGVSLSGGSNGTYDAHVHRLVAIAFVPGSGPIVRHLDGDGFNNVAENLAWGTAKDNEADKARHGRVPRGLSHPNASLSAGQVLSIREMHARGISQLAIARATGINRGTVGNVVRGRSYTNV